jgi:hypothetical protein
MKTWILGALLLFGCGYSPDAPCTRHSDCAPGDECSSRGHCQRIPDAGPDIDGGTAP